MSTMHEQINAARYRAAAAKAAGHEYVGFDPATVLELCDLLAATEAAKATGTAGELPPLPERDGDWAGDDWFTKDTLREYSQASAAAEREACAKMAVQWGDGRMPDAGGNALRNYAAALREGRQPAPSPDAEAYLRERYGAYRGHPEWRALEEAFNAGRRTQPEATAPAQDLSAAILALPLPEPVGKLERRLGVFQSNIESHDVCTVEQVTDLLKAAAALASSANALSAGDRADAEMTFLEEWLTLAATPVGLECCGQSSGDCCGNGVAVERGAEEVISAMAARHRELSAILQSQKGENE